MAKAKEHSFDISAKIDMQHFKDALSQCDKEVANRYDFKGLVAEIDYKEKEKALVLTSSSDNKLEALEDIVIARLLKHGLSSKVLDEIKREDASGNTRRVTYKIVDYIESKEAKKINAEIKNLKLKVTSQIEGDSIRVKGKNLDDLQKVISAIRGMEWEAPLIFENMR
jgi:cyclic-di-GMP-binding protein